MEQLQNPTRTGLWATPRSVVTLRWAPGSSVAFALLVTLTSACQPRPVLPINPMVGGQPNGTFQQPNAQQQRQRQAEAERARRQSVDEALQALARLCDEVVQSTPIAGNAEGDARDLRQCKDGTRDPRVLKRERGNRIVTQAEERSREERQAQNCRTLDRDEMTQRSGTAASELQTRLAGNDLRVDMLPASNQTTAAVAQTPAASEAGSNLATRATTQDYLSPNQEISLDGLMQAALRAQVLEALRGRPACDDLSSTSLPEVNSRLGRLASAVGRETGVEIDAKALYELKPRIDDALEKLNPKRDVRLRTRATLVDALTRAELNSAAGVQLWLQVLYRISGGGAEFLDQRPVVILSNPLRTSKPELQRVALLAGFVATEVQAGKPYAEHLYGIDLTKDGRSAIHFGRLDQIDLSQTLIISAERYLLALTAASLQGGDLSAMLAAAGQATREDSRFSILKNSATSSVDPRSLVEAMTRLSKNSVGLSAARQRDADATPSDKDAPEAQKRSGSPGGAPRPDKLDSRSQAQAL